MDLPKGFTSILDVLEKRVAEKSIISVIGLVKDFRFPIATRGTDYKSTLRLYDVSVSDTNQDIEFVVFRAQKDMPAVGPGDVIVVYQARVQEYNSEYSLKTHNTTAIHVYPAAKIPNPPMPASDYVSSSNADSQRKPNPADKRYASWLYHTIDKSVVPSCDTFQIQATRSLNVKDKLCELKDAKEGTFHDIVVEVVKDPYDDGGYKVTLHVSDYTENSGFFHYTNNGQGTTRDGDPYGYTSRKISKDWAGPVGKKTLQITAYDSHASVIRQKVFKGTWVHLLNVQFKYGSNGQHLEGFLRQDNGAFANKNCVNVIDGSMVSEKILASYKNALRRKREYDGDRKSQIKDLQPARGMSKKRAAPTDEAEEKRLNSKQRRALQRAQANSKARGEEVSLETSLDVNKQVVCENQDQPTIPVSAILESVTYETTCENRPLNVQLPFTCAKYRATVRVVDFHPPNLCDFTCSRKRTEYDILSDVSSSDTETDDDRGGTLEDEFVGERIWEWRFALRLQDAIAAAHGRQAPSDDSSLWVVVDNMEAQLLTGLDPQDLRANPDVLAQLRERMFILWGELEERKTRDLLETKNKRKPKSVMRKQMLNERPPLDSSDNEAACEPQKEKVDKAATISNRPFTCCIRQYGVRVRESNEAKANAGKGRRWERMFGLFGTKVSYIQSVD
ncbi:Protection of telomeres protein 1 [Colletotrichum chlorophyti]|uniref:Protection of telomeres protein 1 n=1 Tax=Colletotrichum chlorophyti TaxID=708187 RepID=A0A1Q8S229_9PEZI|nr:Protection of telomeres protein 1 [Colletotrichum chlorophyti]